MTTTPRGLKNFNPLNLDYHDTIEWQGLADPPSDGRFCRFTSLKWGLRAGFINARSYKTRHGIKTLGQYMNRFAPLGKENPKTYHEYVAEQTGHTLLDTIDLEDRAVIEPILKAQTEFENGLTIEERESLLPQEAWDMAWSLTKPMKKSRTLGGAAGAAAATVAGAIVEVAQQNTEVIAGAAATASSIWPKWAPLIAAAIALCCIGVVVYARLSARREGVR
jgi:hypothetical protein